MLGKGQEDSGRSLSLAGHVRPSRAKKSEVRRPELRQRTAENNMKMIVGALFAQRTKLKHGSPLI